MQVLKFGGSSVGTAAGIEQVKNILKNRKDGYIVVVSALGGVTDGLKELLEESLEHLPTLKLTRLKERHFSLIKDLELLEDEILVSSVEDLFLEIENVCKGVNVLQEISERSEARMLGYGEKLSSRIIHAYLNAQKLNFNYLNSEELIIANSGYTKAILEKEPTYSNIQQKIDTEKNYLAGGFIASNPKRIPVLLGRGGSDYSAAIYAGALSVDKLEIWSDVDGMMNANPRIVQAASKINTLSYEEAFELSYFGAKVLYPPTIRPLLEAGIPLELKNTFSPEKEGTRIDPVTPPYKDPIKGVSALSDIGLLNISGLGMAGKPGTARRIFQSLENAGVNVILITQCCSEQSICVGVKQEQINLAMEHLKADFALDLQRGLLNDIIIDEHYSIVALIGDNMINRIGLSGKVFSTLGENGINIKAIAQGASERNISVVVSKKDESKAINVLHEAFFSQNTKKVHLYVAGIGNVGSQFMNILDMRTEALIEELGIELKLISASNSKKTLRSLDGLKMQDLDAFADQAAAYDSFSDLVSSIASDNLRNAVFVDITASSVVSDHYEDILKAGASIVTCNKIACSSDYERYASLLKLAKHKMVQFKYETCVGAALPVIKSIQDLVQSGDAIHAVDAVLSGSLNYIFNHYNGEKTFCEVVKDAQTLGFTEPNPLIDLSGVDAIRKILILARESGLDINFEDVVNNSFLPDECLEANSAEELFSLLTKHEDHFKKIYERAQANGCRLKVVARFENNKAEFGLQEVDLSHPFYNLDGKDNIFSIRSDRYPEQPLIIKGAGAGAALTASGVFSDLMMIVNK